MAEVTALVASVITISAAVAKSLKTVKNCYRAFDEFETLEVGGIPKYTSIIVVILYSL